ncbi:tRNA (cytidine(56)-2'-O)-methyltransferase [Candidatus Micrarchaeota archaeon]|nr:tRNA (cytidine(56)-2'-O)-methyltransferase [Candidatus Micrarchaeota archaeon]
MVVRVLRLGHRSERDRRITTHVCLVARAFGADEVVVSGENAGEAVSSVEKIVLKWGGDFSVKFDKNWRKILLGAKKKKHLIVHLTMYGERVQDVVSAVRASKDVLVVVGAEKVPREVYELADYNVSVTSQPHSEVAALAVFLHEFFEGKELEKKFEGAKLKLIPSSRGKKFSE